MASKPYSWWQKTKQYWVTVGVVTVVLVVVIALIFVVIRFYGTGFDGYNKISTVRIISGTSSGTITRTEEYQLGKTLWDWLQLLIIPAVLTIGGYMFNLTTKRNEQEIASDNQRETVLQEYIDKMSELLLKEHLRESQPSDEARKIARLRTLTVLHRLDGKRKRIVLQFLYESELICKDKDSRIVELHGADFRLADLKWLHLENAHLGGSFCWEVDFSDAFLHGAYLGGVQFKDVTWNRADLGEAHLLEASFLDADGNKYTTDSIIEEQLKEVKSLRGTLMPYGSVHP